MVACNCTARGWAVSSTIRCDHPECIAPSIGYISRICQGPFFCKQHEEWAWKQFDAWVKMINETEIEETEYEIR